VVLSVATSALAGSGPARPDRPTDARGGALALGSILGQAGPSLSASPPSLAPGGIVTAIWSNVASPTSTDWVHLYTAGAPDTSTQYDYILTGGTASGTAGYQLPVDLPAGATYELRLFSGATGARLAVSNQFTLPTLSVSPPSLAPGGVLTASWSGITGPTSGDWIGLYPVGAPDNELRHSFLYTDGTATGQTGYQLPPDLPVGTYELRLFSNGSWLRLAVSNSFTVPTLSVGATTIRAGDRLTVSWTGIVNPTSTDWIGFFPAGAPDGSSGPLVWQYTGGLANSASGFQLPTSLTAGTYELRLYSNGTWLRLAVAGPLTLFEGGDPDLPAFCSPRPAVSVSFDPASRAGWIGVAAPNSLQSVQFGTATNALIDAGGVVGRTGNFTVSLPAQSTNFAFYVSAISATTGGGVTVPLVVSDACGNWPTFVGSGSGARVATATPTPIPTNTPTRTPIPTAPPSSTPTARVWFQPAVVAPGTPITAFWANIPNPSVADVVRSMSSDKATQYGTAAATLVTGSGSGQATLPVALNRPAGNYYARYECTNCPQIYYDSTTTYAVVAPTATRVPTATPPPGATLRIRTTPPNVGNVGAGGVLTVDWTNVPNFTSQNWIGLFRAGDTSNRLLGWRYLIGSDVHVTGTSGWTNFEFPVHLPLGTYELRLYYNNTWSLMATTLPVPVDVLVWHWPAILTPNSQVTVYWCGLRQPQSTDWFGLYDKTAFDYGYGNPGAGAVPFGWWYSNPSEGSAPGCPLLSGRRTVIIPNVPPGSRQLRFFSQATRIATANPAETVPFTYSHYLQRFSEPTGEDTKLVMGRMGCSRARQINTFPYTDLGVAYGTVILDFGAPIRLPSGNLGMRPIGVPPEQTVGLWSLVASEGVISDIEKMGRDFITGFWNCIQGSQREISIVMGLNNSGQLNDINGVSTPHGIAWGNMVTRLQDWVRSQPPMERQVYVTGGMDTEQNPEFWLAAHTIPWLQSYRSVTRQIFIDWGSCEGCPSQDLYGDWTTDLRARAAYGDQGNSGIPMPLIYFPAQAGQWQALSRRAYELFRPLYPLPFEGAVAQYTACSEPGRYDPQFCGSGAGYTLQAPDALDRFQSALNSDGFTRVPISRATDLSYQERLIP
jgi:hypothetical protein